VNLKTFIIILVLMISGIARAASGEIALPAGVTKPAFFEKQGIQVMIFQKGPGGLNIWKVEKNGARSVFYTTPDNKVLISGVMWDAATGSNLSDALLTPDLSLAPPVGSASAPVLAAGQLPDAIKGIDNLTGIKEGKGGIDRTLYIIFDPRCTHCHAVFEKSRQFVSQGGTIKWIPVTVLGRQSSVAPVAYILQDPSPLKALSAALTVGYKASVPIVPTPETVRAIAENEAYFWAAFERNPGAGQTGVPVGFFLSKEGAPQMVGELDNDVLLKRIFSDMKK